VHDMLLMEVKSPAESHGPFDLLKQLNVLPGAEAFLPLTKSECNLTLK